MTAAARVPRRAWPAGLALVLLLVLLAHSRSLDGDFLLWDDTNHVTQNPAVRALTGDTLRTMFTTPIAKLYVPLTWLSFAVDHQLWGRDPFGYHLTNLLLHLANTALVFFLVQAVLTAARRPPAFPNTHPAPYSGTQAPSHSGTAAIALLTAALFGLHPTRVESVAWVTERKDVLFGFFYLLGLLAWIRWAARGRPAWYAAAFAAFLLSTLAKSAAVTFPAVALILDRWVFGRFQTNTASSRALPWLDKLPFVAAAFLAGLATWHAQATGPGDTIATNAVVPWPVRPGLVGYCALFYLRKFFWPANLSAIYPTFEEMNWTAAAGWLWALAALLLTAALWRFRRRTPLLWPCWLFYLVTLAPTIGLAPVGIHLVADRYAYLPLLGICLATSGAVAWLARRLPAGPPRAGLAAAVAGTLLALTAASAQRTLVWRNTETLFQSVLAVNPRCLPALINLTHWYTRTGQLPAALELGARAVAVAPHSVWARKNLALALLDAQRPAEALTVLAPVADHPLAATAGIPDTIAGIQRLLPPPP